MRPAFVLVLLFLLVAMGLVRVRHSATSEKPEVKSGSAFASPSAPQTGMHPRTEVDDLTIAHRIVQQRDEQLLAIRVRAHWFLTGAELEETARIEAEAENELNKLNIPEEVRAENKSISWRVSRVQQVADIMHLTEAEAAAYSAWLEKSHEISRWFGNPENKTQSELADLSAAMRPIQEENLQAFVQDLGFERFREFQRIGNPVYEEALEFAARYNLAPGIADELTDLGKRWVEERFEVVSKHTPRSEVESILEANLQAHRAVVEAIVGVEAARIYFSDSRHAWWLKQH